MPTRSGISNKYQSQINTNFKNFIGNLFFRRKTIQFDIERFPSEKGNWKFKPAFSLIELVLSIFLILGITALLFSVSGTYIHTRGSNLQGVAAKIATKEIERIRKLDFNSMPSSGTFSDSDLSKLPSSQATRTVSNYQSNDKIKLVTIQIDWQDSGAARNVKLETLMSESGI